MDRRYHSEYIFSTEFIVLNEDDEEETYFNTYAAAKAYIKAEVKSGRDVCFGLLKVRSMSMLTGWGGAELIRTVVLKKYF